MGALCAQEKQPLLFHIGIPERSPANLIKTTSYNPITFLPCTLFSHRPSGHYCSIQEVSQCILFSDCGAAVHTGNISTFAHISDCSFNFCADNQSHSCCNIRDKQVQI